MNSRSIQASVLCVCYSRNSFSFYKQSKVACEGIQCEQVSDLQQVSVSCLNCDFLEKKDSPGCIATRNGVLQHITLQQLGFGGRRTLLRDCPALHVV